MYIMNKFFILTLVFIFSAGQATFGQSPGGVPTNVRLWLKANAGVSSFLGTVSGWSDQSGGGNNASTVNGVNPALTVSAINSYPAITYSGTGGLQGSFGANITANNASAFIVENITPAGTNTAGLFSIAASGAVDSAVASSVSFFESNTGVIATARSAAAGGKYTNANALGQYHLCSSHFSATQNLFYTEGAASTNAAFTAAALASRVYTVGSRYTGSASQYLTGQIAEVILYDRLVSAAERNQIESYLAIKYGITLSQAAPQNYSSSTGAIVWSGTVSSSYKNNIFGVGIDNASGLSQTASVSINTNLLTIKNASSLTNGSFLMVSDNAGGNSLTSLTTLPNNINARLNTVWRATQTGTRTATDYIYNSSATAFGYYAPIAASMTPYMLIDSNADGIYETYLAATAVSGSSFTFNTNLRDGARFTFGYKASIDYGDAPGVPTLIASNGAGHMITAGVYLGALIDAELDGQPSLNSVGDDTIGLADEDGINFNIGVPTNGANIIQIGLTNTITVVASTIGYLNAWIDINQDNIYGGGSEYAIINKALVAGSNTVTFAVSDSAAYGATSMRFRFAKNSGDVTAPTGLATNGEVEDYKVYITAPLVGPCTNGFQNSSFESGPAPASYIITSQNNLPYWRTTATDKMVEVWHTGYNGGSGPVPAYDGTYFVELEANLTGALYQDVYTTPGTTLLWNFAHRGRAGTDTCNLKIGPPGATIQVTKVMDNNNAWGVYQGGYAVPANQYVTRFEFNALGSYGGNNSVGNFLDDVYVSNSFDYGDAPNSYGTLYASNGPYHAMTGTLYLGAGVTCEGDGKPSAAANLDSLDDGVTFPVACANCNTYPVSIKVFNNSGSPATIAGWIDFNKNGVFDSTERASVNVPTSALTQTVTMTFTVNSFSAASATTYARFRAALDSTQIATPYGLATTGEVEDYQVPCVGMPIPLPTSSGSPACARGPLNLYASGSAPYYTWTGPNGYSANGQNPVISAIPVADSGWYRVYAVYANGCERDSAVRIQTKECYVGMTGAFFDDANGNGIIDGADSKTDLSQTLYAVLTDNTNTVLATSLVSANGGFTFAAAPAYMSSMMIRPSTTNPAINSTGPAASWPTRWIGTKGQYGTNNLAGSGLYSTPSQLPVATAITAASAILLGYDQLPTSTPRTYTIPYPHAHSNKQLTPGNSLGYLAGSDPEDGTLGTGSAFTITSLSGMNGNMLYYDANGNGVLQSYEQITGYTVITNYDPTKLYIRFVGAGSTNATFNYGSTDAAGQVDPTPSSYIIKWVGTLPIQLLSFTAQATGGTSLLHWATATETDNAYFVTERSDDGLHWTAVGEVTGAGTSSIEHEYTLTDISPLTGINYYRLKQVDVDGHFTYSDIAEVTFADEGHSAVLVVHPNPLSRDGRLYLNVSNSTDLITHVSLSSSIGEVVYTSDITPTPVAVLTDIHAGPGVYVVTITITGDKQISSRVVIE
jgi:hypothetical protein